MSSAKPLLPSSVKSLQIPSEQISDVSRFRTKVLKATDKEILAAVDGQICPEQAEKLWIIRSHMDGLELCKANMLH